MHPLLLFQNAPNFTDYSATLKTINGCQVTFVEALVPPEFPIGFKSMAFCLKNDLCRIWGLNFGLKFSNFAAQVLKDVYHPIHYSLYGFMGMRNGSFLNIFSHINAKINSTNKPIFVALTLFA